MASKIPQTTLPVLYLDSRNTLIKAIKRDILAQELTEQLLNSCINGHIGTYAFYTKRTLPAYIRERGYTITAHLWGDYDANFYFDKRGRAVWAPTYESFGDLVGSTLADHTVKAGLAPEICRRAKTATFWVVDREVAEDTPLSGLSPNMAGLRPLSVVSMYTRGKVTKKGTSKDRVQWLFPTDLYSEADLVALRLRGII